MVSLQNGARCFGTEVPGGKIASNGIPFCWDCPLHTRTTHHANTRIQLRSPTDTRFSLTRACVPELSDIHDCARFPNCFSISFLGNCRFDVMRSPTSVILKFPSCCHVAIFSALVGRIVPRRRECVHLCARRHWTKSVCAVIRIRQARKTWFPDVVGISSHVAQWWYRSLVFPFLCLPSCATCSLPLLFFAECDKSTSEYSGTRSSVVQVQATPATGISAVVDIPSATG